MPIDSVQLMRLMEDTIGRAAVPTFQQAPRPWKTHGPDSYLENLSDGSGSKIESLQTILANHANFLLALAEIYENRELVSLSEAAKQIEYFLGNFAGELERPQKGVPRLTGLVYPVV